MAIAADRKRMVAADGHEPAAVEADVPRDCFHGGRRYRRGIDIREHEQIAVVEACPVGEHLGRTTLDGKPGLAQRAGKPIGRRGGACDHQRPRALADQQAGRHLLPSPPRRHAASRNALSQSGLVATTTRRGRDGLKIEANDASQCRGIGGGGLGARPGHREIREAGVGWVERSEPHQRLSLVGLAALDPPYNLRQSQLARAQSAAGHKTHARRPGIE